jgi:hypothetical protein
MISQQGGDVIFRTLFGSAIGVAMCTSAATAQLCQGTLPFSASRTHVGGALGFSDNTTSLGAGLTLGHAKGLYGGGSLGFVDYDGIDGSSFTLNGGIGYQMPLAQGSKWELCPGATVSFVFGPSNVAPIDADYSSQTLTAGASVGSAIPMNPKFNLIPFGTAALGLTHMKVSAGGLSDSNTDAYFVLGFGAGLQFSPKFVVTPGLTFPIGADNADNVIFNIGVTFGLPGHAGSPARR